MSLRPAAANWFELLVMRDDLAGAMRALAESACVELQGHGRGEGGPLPTGYGDQLNRFVDLERRYGGYWPAAAVPQLAGSAEPYAMLRDAMRSLQQWVRDASARVAEVEDLATEQHELEALLDMLRHAGSLPELARLSKAGPLLQACAFLMPGDDWPETLPGSVVTERIAAHGRSYLVAVGLPDQVAALKEQLHALRAREIHLPAELPSQPAEAAALTARRIDTLEGRLQRLQSELEALNDKHHVAAALANVHFVRWYSESVPELSMTENFAWVTGWTSDVDGDRLIGLLADVGIRGVLRMTEPPPGFEPPLLLRNPRWMRPFEAFTAMLGMPGAAEADPTRILAVVSPLMFAYMFGDVGHGAVLLIAGLILGRRSPPLRLLAYGGAMSILFGFLFGSVFALETVVHPLWVYPLDAPVSILIIPMFGGAALLLVGMLLDALQSFWQRKSRYWWETGAGLVLCYVALLASILDVRWLWAAAAGAAWFVLGHAFVVAERRLAAIGMALAELVESILQLAVNTVSFVRVGAFALAHSALSLAVVGLADAAPSMSIAVLVVGNILIIGLEGLVVSIQTTRLVLFEFFIRFLRAGGRPFRPLAPLHSFPLREHRRPQ